jgi:ATP-dependent RNA helicase DeaD
MTDGNSGGTSGFAGLMLAPELCDALSALGYEEPTPIQQAAIPPLLAGRDLVGQAATGTGKTAAFALPVLERVLADSGRAEPLALVLVPTRELATQVSQAMSSYGRGMGGNWGRSGVASTLWWQRRGARSTTSTGEP